MWDCGACGAENQDDETRCAACGAARQDQAGAQDDVPAQASASAQGSKTVREDAIADPLAAIRGAAILSSGGEAPPLPGPDNAGRTAPRVAATVEVSAERLQAAAQRASGPAAGAKPARAPATVLTPALAGPAKENASSPPPRGPAPAATASAGPSARPVWGRIAPLLVISSAGIVLLVWATMRLATDEGQTPTPTAAGSERAQAAPGARRIALPPVRAVIGLTQQNREDVLAACFRLSDNANHECRVSTLEARGEAPSREVDFGAFEVDRLEVSNADYDACVNAGACAPRTWDQCRFYTVLRYEMNTAVPERMRAGDRPAVCVTLAEASAYCVWAGGRLPTAEEWERVARAGDERLQPWGAFWLPGVLNWGERDMTGFPIPGRLDGEELTAPVDAYPDGATPEGVLNLFGNAAEWVSVDDEGRGGVRGGSYADDVRVLRATYQELLPAGERRSTLAFRCVYGGAPAD